MAENSKIEWTDHTFNAWRGCTKVSPGCAHCYADLLDGVEWNGMPEASGHLGPMDGIGAALSPLVNRKASP